MVIKKIQIRIVGKSYTYEKISYYYNKYYKYYKKT